jgi:alkanesulfonate monooxygenase SsuD/methylene tetrahydromethanopterin reductase-like flavin-dependent oxidoreductase (luciferase family)
MAADVDRISGGRLVLGLGIGDMESEFRQLGVRFPGTRERMEALEEAIRILRGLWGQGPVPPPGPHFGVDASPFTTPPVQRPGIPLMIAGGGTRVTLRQVAQFADASNFGEHDWTGGVRGDAQLAERLDALQRHCAALGRPAETVLRTHTTVPLILAETSDDIAAKIDRFVPAYAHTSGFMTDAVALTPPEAVA